MAKQLNVNLKVGADTSSAKAAFQDLQNTLQNLTKSSSSINSKLPLTKEIQEATMAADQLRMNLEKAVNTDTGKINLAKFQQQMQQSGMSIEKYGAALSKLGPQGQQAFAQLARSMVSANVSFANSNTLVNQLWTTLKNTARWQLSSSALKALYGGLQTAYHYAQDLNESLNNIRIVTGQSADEMARFAQVANQSAQSLSTSTNDYLRASLIYYQQGLSDEEVKARTDVTIKMANVSRQSAQTVSDQMTAIWNNFAKGTENLEHYADAITALGASTASSSEEIAQGMSKFAAVADTVGLSYDKAAAAIATVVAETRQSADIVGTAFRTILARIEGLNLGETLEDGVTLNKYSEALAKVGVDILDQNNNLKDMNSILDDIGAKWNTLNEAQKVALSETVAGTRQYAQFMALMENYDKVLANEELAKNSDGSLQNQADIYAESWEAARKRVQASAEAIYSALLNDKFFIKLSNVFADLLKDTKNFIDGLGGLKGVLATVGTLVLTIFNSQISTAIDNLILKTTTLFTTSEQRLEKQKELMRQTIDQMYQMGEVAQQKANAASTGGAVSKQANIQAEEMRFTADVYKELGDLQINYLSNLQQMSETEKTLYENALNRYGVEADELVLLKKKAIESEQIAQKEQSDLQAQLAMAQRRTSLSQGRSQAEASIDVKNTISQFKELSEELKNLESSSDFAKKIDSTLESIDLEPLKLDIYDIEDAWRRFDEGDSGVFDSILQNMRNLQTELKSTGQDTSELEQKIKNFDDAMHSNWMPEAEHSLSEYRNIIEGMPNSLELFNQKQEELITLLSNAGISNAGTLVREYADALMAAGNNTELVAEAHEKFKQRIQETVNSMRQASTETLTWGQAITSAGRVLSSLNMIINNIEGLISVFNDDSKTASDRLKALIGTLGMVIPTLASLIPLWQSLNITIGTTSITLLGLIGIIAAATIAIWGIIELIKLAEENSPEGKLKAAKEEAKAMKEALDETRQAAEDLRDSFNSYDSVVEQLKNCVRGTEEWYSLLSQLDKIVDDLIDKYPELANMIEYKDGIPILPENWREEVLEKTREAENRQSAVKHEADRDQAKAQLVQDISNDVGAAGFKNGWTTVTIPTGSVPVYSLNPVSDSVINEAIINAILSNEGILNKLKNGETDIADALKEILLEQFDAVNIDENKLTKFLENNLDSILNLSNGKNPILANRLVDQITTKRSETSAESDSKYASEVTEASADYFANAVKEAADNFKNGIDEDTAKDIFNQAKEQGILEGDAGSQVFTGFDKNGNISYTYNQGDKTGEKGTIDRVTEENIYSGGQAAQKTEEFVDNLFTILEGKTTSEAEKILSGINGNAKIGLDSDEIEKELAALDKLDKFIIDKKEAANYFGISLEEVEALGTTYGEMIKKRKQALEDSKAFLEGTIEDLNGAGQEAANELKDKVLNNPSLKNQLNIEDIKAYGNTVNKVFEEIEKTNEGMGEEAAKAFESGVNELIDKYPDKAKEILKIVNNTDFTKADALSNMSKQLSEIGVNLSKCGKAYSDFAKIVKASGASWGASLSDVIKQITTLIAEMKKLNQNDFIDPEKFDELKKWFDYAGIDINNFVATYADGSHQLKASTEEWQQALFQVTLAPILNDLSLENEEFKEQLQLLKEIHEKNIENLSQQLKTNKSLKDLKKIFDDLDPAEQRQIEKLQEIANKLRELALRAIDAASNMQELASALSSLQDTLGDDAFGALSNDLLAEGLSRLSGTVNSSDDLAQIDQFVTDEKLQDPRIKQGWEDSVNNAIAGSANNLGISQEELSQYVDLLKDYIAARDEINGLEREASQLETLALKNAESAYRMQEGYDALPAALAKAKEAIEDFDNLSNDLTIDTMKSLGDLHSALEKIFGMDVSRDFISKHLKDIEEMADGSIEAVQRLQRAITEDYVESLAKSFDSTDKEVAKSLRDLKKYIQNTEDIFKDVKVGDPIEEDFRKAMNKLLASGKMTEKQVTKILNGLGYDVDFDYVEKDFTGLTENVMEEIQKISSADPFSDLISSAEQSAQDLRAALEQAFQGIDGIDIGNITDDVMNQIYTLAQEIASKGGMSFNEALQSAFNAISATIPVSEEEVGGVDEEMDANSSTTSTVHGHLSLSGPLAQLLTDSAGDAYNQVQWRGESTIEGKANSLANTKIKVPVIGKGGTSYNGGGNGQTASPSKPKSSGGGGGGGGGGGSKPKPRKAVSPRKEEPERYHSIKKQIEDLTQAYEKADKAKERLFGVDRIKAMETEIKLTDQLIHKQQVYLKEIKANLQKDRDALLKGKDFAYEYTTKDVDGNETLHQGRFEGVEKTVGVTPEFDKNGVMLNYEEVVKKFNEWYRDAIYKYNNMNGEAQEAMDNAGYLDKINGQYDAFMEYLEQYEETVDLWQEELEKVIEYGRQIQDIELEKLQYKIEIQVTVNDADLKRLESIRERLADDVWKSVEYLDLLFNQAEGALSQYSTLIERGSIYAKNIEELLNATHGDVQIDENTGEILGMGQYSDQDWLDELGELEDGLYDVVEQWKELDDEMLEYYENTLGAVLERLDEISARIEDDISVLEHYQDLSVLFGKEQDYQWIGKIINGIVKVNKANFDRARAEYEEMNALYEKKLKEYNDAVASGELEKEELDILKHDLEVQEDAMRESRDKMLNIAKSYAESIATEYETTINRINKAFEDLVTNGMGFDFLNSSMERVSSTQDMLLTKTNQIYETNKLMRQLAQDIDKTDNRAAKTKLSNFAKEIKALQEQNKMSKFDLDVAKARYELLLAQIALEEAQNAKSTVRLQRDSEGNYGYVYTANQDEIENAEQNVADKQNDLYNLVLDKTNSSREEMIQLYQDYQSALMEISTNSALTEEERNAQSLQLTQEYYEKLKVLEGDNATALYWLNETAATGVQEAWSDAYEANILSSQDWKDRVTEDLDEIMAAAQLKKEQLDELAKTLGLSLEENLDEEINKITEDAKKLENQFIETLNEGSKILTQVSDRVSAYVKEREAIRDLIEGYEKWIKTIDETRRKLLSLQNQATWAQNTDATPDPTTGLPDVDYGSGAGGAAGGGGGANGAGGGGGGDNSGNGGSNNPGGAYNPGGGVPYKVGEETEYLDARDGQNHFVVTYNVLSNGKKILVPGSDKIKKPHSLKLKNGTSGNEYVCRFCGYIKYVYGGKEDRPFDTGGYTGDWTGGSDKFNGKLAMLHEKELVLNSDDTKNFLNAVHIVRSISQMIDLRAAAQNLTPGLNTPYIGNNSQVVEQSVTIHAEFPNANNHIEIEEAFNNLINRASQYVGRS